MRKYGLSREPRTQVVRATGGSCRFEDVQRVLRASDFEDRHDSGGRQQIQRGTRKKAAWAVASDSEMSQPSLAATEDEALEMDDEEATEDEELQQSLEEAFKVKKKAKANVKKEARQDLM